MGALGLAIAYLRRRPLSTALNMALLAAGVATIALLTLFSQQLEQRMLRDANGIDMVVGAKGGPTQLILSAIYHLDVPTGNVRLTDADALARDPMIAATIPLALGDSFRRFRIVGTTVDYVAHYRGALADGRLWEQPLEVTVGALVAAEAGLTVGRKFVGNHGLAGGPSHGEAPFTVVGVLAPTGTVLDRLVLTSVESVWRVHGLIDDGPRGPGAAVPDLEITAILVKFATPMAAALLPRKINMETAMQAALPSLQIARLFRLVGFGVEGFRAFAIVLVASAGLGMFAALYNALDERRYDLAIMRTLGARRRRILWQILLEGLILSLCGGALGFMVGHGAAELAGGWLWREHQLYLTGWTVAFDELWLAAATVGLGLVAALIPALHAYRLDVSGVLAKR